MKILIIGGSRFVGPLLIKTLSKLGHELTVFNRGNIDTDYPLGVRYVKGDREKSFGLEDKFNVVIDMCAYVAPHTAKAINDLNFDYFLNFGTAASYAKSEIFPLTEESPIGDWTSFGAYNKGKVECERVLEKSGIKHCTFRPVYILGPKNHLNRENFIYSRIKQGKPMTLPGNGLSLTQFVFVDEVASSIAALVEHQPSGSFNIAGDQAITLLGLVQSMGRIVGKKPITNFNPNAVGPNFIEEEFPFMNENFIVSNKKIKQYGVKFMPLIERLQKDYKSYYKDRI